MTQGAGRGRGKVGICERDKILKSMNFFLDDRYRNVLKLCETCQAWHEAEGKNLEWRRGTCRRNPPTMDGFPTRTPGSWCLAWVPTFELVDKVQKENEVQ